MVPSLRPASGLERRMTNENPYNINRGQYLACPSCGGDVICYSESNDRLVCDYCGCSMRSDRWNTRVYPPEVQAAIDRDVPKRPIIRPMGWIDFNADHCPSCDTKLHEYTDKNVTFCYSCGQRLDWSEECQK